MDQKANPITQIWRRAKDKIPAPVRNYFNEHPVQKKIMKVGLAGFVIFVIISSTSFLGILGDIPSRKELKAIQNATASEVYSEDGILLGKYFIEERTNVEFEDISPNVINALIATEDARFYNHNGIDNIGMLRVIFKSIILQDESSGGGSTLSQQLAKNLFPRKQYLFFSIVINKIREAIIARKLEKIFSKEEILTLYLNTVPFGENAFGIHTGAKRFFSKTPNQLKAEEAALLIGLLKANTTYNPRKYPERALQRRNVVLEQMSKYEYITKKEADSLKAIPIQLKLSYSSASDGLAPYFRQQLRMELDKWCNEHKKEDGSKYNLYTDGLKIYTTINSKMQKYAEEATREHMKALQKSFYDHWGNQKPWAKAPGVIKDAKKRSQRYKALKEQGLSEEEIDNIFKTPVKMKVYTINGPKVREMSPLDSIMHHQYFLHSGFMAMDPKTGYIKAWVGGIDHHFFKYDHVNKNTKRQVGSTFKPIVYATALESGMSPCEYIPNDRRTYENYNNWSPANADNVYGGQYSLAGGLTNSVNTISAELIMRIGPDKVAKFAENMGIESELEQVPSLALGTADISLMEMVTAYATFPNKGLTTEPVYILRIEDRNGNVIQKHKAPAEKQRALSPKTAIMMTEMLKNVVNSGTASRLRYQYGLDSDIAGKTGTTQGHADGWFIGFTPDLVAGAWVGAEDRRIRFRSLALGQGANMALPIFGKFLSKVYKDPDFKKMKRSQFDSPDPEIQLAMDCLPYLEPVDTTNFWQQLFHRKSKDSINIARKKEVKAKKDEKYQETYEKIRNMFRRKRY
ncbi:MAG TPA: PBP1A family penicillin-binding protein [Cytophagaceae bacterium]